MSDFRDLDFERIGRRVRERRLRMRMTTRELAERSEVTRQTIVRLESGKPCKRETLTRIQHVLGLFTDILIRDDPAHDFCAEHRPEDTHWGLSRRRAEYQHHGELAKRKHEDDPAERQRLARLGFQPFFTAVLNSELPGGVLNQGLMEIHRESWVDRHPGEEFCYCLRGRGKIRVRDVDFPLEEGGAITFKGSDPHQYFPAEPAGPDEPPFTLLIVVAILPGDAPREEPPPPGMGGEWAWRKD